MSADKASVEISVLAGDSTSLSTVWTVRLSVMPDIEGLMYYSAVESVGGQDTISLAQILKLTASYSFNTAKKALWRWYHRLRWPDEPKTGSVFIFAQGFCPNNLCKDMEIKTIYI